MRKFQQLYVKYLIKTSALFYGFVGLFLVLFLGLSLNIKLDVVKSYPAIISGDVIIIERANIEPVMDNKIYYYINRNELIYQAEAIEINTNDAETNILIIKNEENEVSGGISVDLIVGKQTLLERIFVKAGKN